MLYREFSSENFDYYGITDETSCPLCKLDHGDEESIEGRQKTGSYFIKCEQRKIEIVAQSSYIIDTSKDGLTISWKYNKKYQ